jgi:hypothetical protein
MYKHLVIYNLYVSYLGDTEEEKAAQRNEWPYLRQVFSLLPSQKRNFPLCASLAPLW